MSQSGGYQPVLAIPGNFRPGATLAALAVLVRDAERELGEVVRADREPVEDLGEGLGLDGFGSELAAQYAPDPAAARRSSADRLFHLAALMAADADAGAQPDAAEARGGGALAAAATRISSAFKSA